MVDAFAGLGMIYVGTQTKVLPGYVYFKSQPSLTISKEFIETTLKELIELAESENKSTVYVPGATKHSGSTGISTWYAKALLENYNA